MVIQYEGIGMFRMKILKEICNRRNEILQGDKEDEYNYDELKKKMCSNEKEEQSYDILLHEMEDDGIIQKMQFETLCVPEEVPIPPEIKLTSKGRSECEKLKQM